MSDDPYFVRELECAGKTLKIKQLYIGDVGCVVWDAAIVLCKFLENVKYFPPLATSATSCLTPQRQIHMNDSVSQKYWSGKKVIDIGSGTGVVGIAASLLGAHVTVTDLEEFVPLMSTNIELNKDVIQGTAIARTLTWGQDVSSFIMPHPSVILLADVVYYKKCLGDLLKTLLELSVKHTEIVMSYEERTTGDKPEIERMFFKMMGDHFNMTNIPFEDLDSTFRSTDIHLVKFSLKT